MCSTLRRISLVAKRFVHTVGGRSSWVVLTDDGSTIVCWHPEQPFPYEHSKPIVRPDPELKESDSALKVQVRLDHKHRYRQLNKPPFEELQEITYTTKHQWYPNSKDKYAKKLTRPRNDREGI